ncbi:MAG TPA: hypothetical protein VE684_13630 [Crenalkalicoccus sp.]|nr:hypothetical protein [Crenalkalicoccus sp.]
MADGFLSGLSRRARDMAGEYGEDAARRLGGGVEELRNRAGRYGQEAGGRAGAAADRYGRLAARRIGDTAEETRGELRRLWSQLEDLVERRLGPAAAEAVDRAGEYGREGREMAVDAAEYLRERARAQPLLAIGVAVAATLLVVSLLSSSRRD